MKIDKSKCIICGNETNFGIIYYMKIKPICIECIDFFKKLKKREYLFKEIKK